MFARYALPPNRHGYCGPDDPGALFDTAVAGPDAEIEALAKAFDGAWPYLELIATANRIADPLDTRVVEAYWVGNALLWRVDMQTMGNSLEERFKSRAGMNWGVMSESIPAGASPHHSYHVFGVYPWVGLLKSGPTEHPMKVLDGCRIRWGMVVSVDGDTAVVRSRPLTYSGRRLGYGNPVEEIVTWASGGTALIEEPKPGEVVALHWDWLCDRLTPTQLSNLRWWTQRHLDLANDLPRPGPASILD
ncbi:hypothetical protein HQ535_09665 [bacterium]|nr:hypothetical protein [bacterium]